MAGRLGGARAKYQFVKVGGPGVAPGPLVAPARNGSPDCAVAALAFDDPHTLPALRAYAGSALAAGDAALARKVRGLISTIRRKGAVNYDNGA
jgi:hypothetical protein